MSIRDWVIQQLRKQTSFAGKPPPAVEAVGSNGVKVIRPGRPDAIAYCLEPDSVNPFTTDGLVSALGELPQAGMVVVTRRLADPDVYQRASELNVCVDTFGGFVRAIDDFDDISQYVHPEEKYVRARLAATRAVTSVARRGHRAWTVVRTDGLRPLTIVTVDRYELTDEQFAAVLHGYPKLTMDALVVTNPNAQGFGSRVINSAQQAGVPLLKIDDFVRRIREPWT
jgi:hypothetical protein